MPFIDILSTLVGKAIEVQVSGGMFDGVLSYYSKNPVGTHIIDQSRIEFVLISKCDDSI